MDTSETYIEMCKKAKEIQELRRFGIVDEGTWQDGDFYFTEYNIFKNSRVWVPGTDVFSAYAEDEYQYSLHNKGNGFHLFRDNRAVWLPRQDQLQDMIGNFTNCLQIMIDLEPGIYQSDSFEKLWLMKVMSIKFKKQWDMEKKEWVAIND